MPPRLGVLSRSPKSYATRRLLAAGRERGLEIASVDYARLDVRFGGAGEVELSGDHAEPAEFDYVLGRISPVYTPLGASILRAYRLTGARCTPGPDALLLSRDKFQSLLTVAAAGVPTPTTALLSDGEGLRTAAEDLGGYPLVVKPLSGTHGLGVELVRDAASAQDLLARLAGEHKGSMVQEFIGEAAGRDVRAVVCGERVVAAITREAAHGEFRSNLHLGGAARETHLSAREIDYAVRAARALDLGIAGVDLLRSARGPLVLEVNASPGLAGIEGATGIDVAGAMIDYLLTRPAVCSTT